MMLLVAFDVSLIAVIQDIQITKLINIVNYNIICLNISSHNQLGG